MLKFLTDWLAADRDAHIALHRFTGHPYSLRGIRNDLYKFIVLLGREFDIPGVEEPETHLTERM